MFFKIIFVKNERERSITKIIISIFSSSSVKLAILPFSSELNPKIFEPLVNSINISTDTIKKIINQIFKILFLKLLFSFSKKFLKEKTNKINLRNPKLRIKLSTSFAIMIEFISKQHHIKIKLKKVYYLNNLIFFFCDFKYK